MTDSTTSPVSTSPTSPSAESQLPDDQGVGASSTAVADVSAAAETKSERSLEDLMQRVKQLVDLSESKPNRAALAEHTSTPAPAVNTSTTTRAATTSPVADAKPAKASKPKSPDPFVPNEPRSLREAHLSDSEVEALALKFLLSRGDASGRSIADQVKLPFMMIEPLLASMKWEQIVAHRGSAPMNDYLYQLTDRGRDRARRLAEHCTYFGSAPVALSEYIKSVGIQSLQQQHPTEEDLKRAFQDLLIDPAMLRRLGPAINSGRGLFLYGSAGNGKTSIAERITSCFGEHIWIPRALGVDGEIIRLFDPSNHQEAPLDAGSGLLDEDKLDKRWVRIRRPTIIVGGELTMDSLEVTLNTSTGISEAPMQLKSNCGTLVIDDFGRQRMRTDELLNRWIVPLEKRYDYLNLPNGKKIQVPFDQLIVFSTNLEPKQLVDDAFLRRIPYKIEANDPTEEAFRELFRIMAPHVGCQYDADALDYLVDTHYKAVARPYRCCQPRDLLLQIRNHCLYQKTEPRMSRENFDFAVENYFAVM
ncbi:MAG: AAA family ATPase [Planctomycetia bacterium]|nr:AAA family ATPase [Planctomycetia bacterium]